jgi:hypothetical protein
MKRFFLLVIFYLANQLVVAQVHLDTDIVSQKKSQESNLAVRYYYYPNLRAYFDTRNGLFIYKKGNSWITAESMPANLMGYGLYNNTFVILNGYVGDEPYAFIEEHRKQFPPNYSNKRRKKEDTNQLSTNNTVTTNKYL